jgi:hypothetical protein
MILFEIPTKTTYLLPYITLLHIHGGGVHNKLSSFLQKVREEVK